jgi:hypothetical protein
LYLEQWNTVDLSLQYGDPSADLCASGEPIRRVFTTKIQYNEYKNILRYGNISNCNNLRGQSNEIFDSLFSVNGLSWSQ